MVRGEKGAGTQQLRGIRWGEERGEEEKCDQT
jgi:hypothetical protein